MWEQTNGRAVAGSGAPRLKVTRLMIISGIIAVLLGLLTLAVCLALLAASFLTEISTLYWTACFFLCLISLTACIAGYFEARRISRGGALVFNTFIAIFWLLYLATLLCSFFAFDHPVDKVVAAMLVIGIWFVRQYASPFWFGLRYLVKTTEAEESNRSSDQEP